MRYGVTAKRDRLVAIDKSAGQSQRDVFGSVFERDTIVNAKSGALLARPRS